LERAVILIQNKRVVGDAETYMDKLVEDEALRNLQTQIGIWILHDENHHG
jgi:hypothetical protein